MSPLRIALAAGVLLAVGITTLAVVAPWSNDTAAPPPRWVRSYQALCNAAASADHARARQVFLDDAHDDLHRLAAALGQRDASRAGRLLEAKERVEAELDDPTADLSPSLQRLAALTRHAAGGLGEPIRVRCAEPGSP